MNEALVQRSPGPLQRLPLDLPVGLRPWRLLAVIVFGVILFAIKLTGLPNLNDNEWRLSAYVLDIVQNGHWFVQTDTSGDPASKPPLLTWLASLVVLPTGEISRFALYWPSAFATVAVALVLLRAGTKMFDWHAGFLAASTYLLSYAALNQMEMPRYDGLLALPVILAALTAFKAWQTGRGWTLFWFLAAIGTLVKGPIALLLSAAGLLATFWELSPRAPARESHGPGFILYLAIVGGWFSLAYWQMGPPLIDKMLKRELVGHAVSGYSVGRDFISYFEPIGNFLRSYAPWSLLTFLALWRVFKRPAADPSHRQFERFLALSVLAGLVIFTLGTHQRGRLVLPLIPAAALLAGRELARWTRHFSPRQLFRLTGAAAALFLFGIAVHSHILLASSRGVQQTLALSELVRRLKKDHPADFPFTYLDNSHCLQVAASTRRPLAPRDEVLKLLAGELPAFVVVTDSVFELDQTGALSLHEVFRWPDRGTPKVRIISNHPRLEWTPQFALWPESAVVNPRAVANLDSSR